MEKKLFVGLCASLNVIGVATMAYSCIHYFEIEKKYDEELKKQIEKLKNDCYELGYAAGELKGMQEVYTIVMNGKNKKKSYDSED